MKMGDFFICSCPRSSRFVPCWDQPGRIMCVCEQIDHRKGLEAIEGINLTLTKSMPGLHPSEKGLVLCQQTGAFFTEDTRRHCGGTGQCPKCHQPDSRKHRLEECPQVLHVRNAFPSLMAQWDTLSEQVKYYGLISEPPDYRAWAKMLDGYPLSRRPTVCVHRWLLSFSQIKAPPGCFLFGHTCQTWRFLWSDWAGSSPHRLSHGLPCRNFWGSSCCTDFHKSSGHTWLQGGCGHLPLLATAVDWPQ